MIRVEKEFRLGLTLHRVHDDDTYLGSYAPSTVVKDRWMAYRADSEVMRLCPDEQAALFYVMGDRLGDPN